MKFNTDHWDKWLNQAFVDEGITLTSHTIIDNYFRHGQRYRTQDGTRKLQCIWNPLFYPIRYSYEIFERDERYYILKTECESSDPRPIKMKVRRQLGTIPIFSYTHQEVDAHVVSQWLEQLNISVPILTRGPIGADGTHYELCLESGFQSVRYMWWSMVSDEWQELDKRFKDILTQMSTLFKET